MEQTVIKHNDVNLVIEQMLYLLKNIDESINNLQINLESINQAWVCENGTFVKETSLARLNRLKEEKSTISTLVKKITDKLSSYDELEQKVIDMMEEDK